MHISELRIRHFRNFLRARFVFRKGVNTLIGENGSGKTNVLYALRLLLDESLARNAAYLRETDFCRALGDWQGHWVVIAVDFEDLDPCEGCQQLKHSTGHMNGSASGTYSLMFRPKKDIRAKLHDMAVNSVRPKDFKAFLNTVTVDDYEPVLTGRAQADMLDDSVYCRVAGDFSKYVFPDPTQDDQAALGVRVDGSSVQSELTCTFVQALRDVVADLRGYRSNPLLALLRGTESSIKLEDQEQITSAVADLNKSISSLPEVQKIAAGVQSTLHATVGHTFSPSVSIDSALPDRIDKLLQKLAVRVGDDARSEYRGDLNELSLGGANLIYLALKLLEYEFKLSGDRVAHFLLIEEPEAHIHTHIQKTLFQSEVLKKTQVILSTHSTHISSAAKIRNVNILARKQDHAEVFQPSFNVDARTAERVERYLDAVRSTLLFAKGVILVEGEAELIMIPALAKAALDVSLDELGISVIAMNAAFFEHIAIVFHDDRVRRRCAIVTDRDQSLLPLSADPEKDDKRLRHLREAQKVGASRREALLTFAGNNPWLKPFFGKHTFEVEFIASGNVSEVIRALDAIYQNPEKKAKSEAKLGAEDLAVSGLEVLRLANKVGKGWFALLLSENLNARTVIPEYILKAIAFACAESIKADTLKRIALFRCINAGLRGETSKKVPATNELEGLPAEEVIKFYTGAYENDQLSRFTQFVGEFQARDQAEL
jgi:putative ATP-dependent endonuclease of OLD family